jgi:hypothetical protein
MLFPQFGAFIPPWPFWLIILALRSTCISTSQTIHPLADEREVVLLPGLPHRPAPPTPWTLSSSGCFSSPAPRSRAQCPGRPAHCTTRSVDCTFWVVLLRESCTVYHTTTVQSPMQYHDMASCLMLCFESWHPGAKPGGRRGLASLTLPFSLRLHP